MSFIVSATQIKLTHIDQLMFGRHSIISANASALRMQNMLGHVLLLGLFVEALSAQRHVHVCSTDHFLAGTGAGSEGVVGVGGANLANCGEFFHFLAERNQLQNIGPTFLFVCAI